MSADGRSGAGCTAPRANSSTCGGRGSATACGPNQSNTAGGGRCGHGEDRPTGGARRWGSGPAQATPMNAHPSTTHQQNSAPESAAGGAAGDGGGGGPTDCVVCGWSAYARDECPTCGLHTRVVYIYIYIFVALDRAPLPQDRSTPPCGRSEEVGSPTTCWRVEVALEAKEPEAIPAVNNGIRKELHSIRESNRQRPPAGAVPAQEALLQRERRDHQGWVYHHNARGGDAGLPDVEPPAPRWRW